METTRDKSSCWKAVVAVPLMMALPALLRAQEPRLLRQADSGPAVWGALRTPNSPGPHPAVILLHGSAGWQPAYLSVADRFAAAGFAALILDYYAETGGAPIGSTEKLQKWESWRRTVQAAVAYLKDLPSVEPEGIALVGYSRGAFLAVSVAGSTPEVKAVVDFYGGGGGGTLTLEQEVQGLPPLLILHGEKDSVVGVSFAEALRSAVLDAGGQVEVHLFPGEDHVFNLPGEAKYSPDADEESLALTLDFLRRTLVRQPCACTWQVGTRLRSLAAALEKPARWACGTWEHGSSSRRARNLGTE